MAQVKVSLKHLSGTASEATVRKHKIPVDRTESKGGTDTGAMGGEIFLAGLGGCFLGTLLEAVRARELSITDIAVEVAGEIAEKPTRFSDITMTVTGNYPDRKEMEKLVTIAERGCIVSNTIRNAVNIKAVLA